MKLSDYVVQFVADLGVNHVFMLAGGGAMHLVDSAGCRRDLEFVCNLHEQACTIAMEAYARVTNNLGVAIVTTGPGGTNAITGVAGAWLESTPCMVLSGQVKREDMKGDLGVRQLGPQELDIVSIVSPITKYAVTITDPSTIRYHLERAVFLAKSGRPGPVWIDIPLDVQAAQVDSQALPGFDPTQEGGRYEAGPNLSDLVARVIRLLNESERPVLLVGNGVRLARAEEDLLQLVERLGIPVLTTWMGTDLLWDDHPLFFGKPGTVAPRGSNFIIQNSDCLITIGARLDAAVTGFNQRNFARAARKAVVDVDDSEIRKLKMDIDVPVCADAGEFIQEAVRQQPQILIKDRRQWLEKCQEWRRRYPIILPEYSEQGDYVNTYVLADILAEELIGSDLIIPGSSGVGIDTFWLAFRVKKGQRLFSTGGLGAMGFGIPASLGGCIASGKRRTICVEGDGSFQLNIQELETVVRLNLPIKYFVLNNGGFASVRATQRNHFKGHLVGCDTSSGLSLPDIVKVAAAYGIQVSRILSHVGLREGVRAVLETRGPVVCEVKVAPDQSIGPRVSSAVRADGSMVSKPLEDLWPFLDRDEFLANMIVPPLQESL